LRTPIWLCALALAASTGCEQGGADARLRISGDTLIAINTIEIDGVPQAAECRATFGAYMDEGGEATIVAGSVSFRFDDGSELARMMWNSGNIKEIFPQNTVTQDKPQASIPVGISASLPVRPITGEASFDYQVGDDSTRTAAPFSFRCQ
jgi:hypothetical protein